MFFIQYYDNTYVLRLNVIDSRATTHLGTHAFILKMKLKDYVSLLTSYGGYVRDTWTIHWDDHTPQVDMLVDYLNALLLMNKL